MSDQQSPSVETLSALLAEAKAGRRCLAIRRDYHGNWRVQLKGRTPTGSSTDLDAALSKALAEASAEETAPCSYDPALLAELLSKLGKNQYFSFQADFRKSGGNVFAAQLGGWPQPNRKLGKDAGAVLGEVLGKAGLL